MSSYISLVAITKKYQYMAIYFVCFCFALAITLFWSLCIYLDMYKYKSHRFVSYFSLFIHGVEIKTLYNKSEVSYANARWRSITGIPTSLHTLVVVADTLRFVKCFYFQNKLTKIWNTLYFIISNSNIQILLIHLVILVPKLCKKWLPLNG